MKTQSYPTVMGINWTLGFKPTVSQESKALLFCELFAWKIDIMEACPVKKIAD